MASTPSAVAIRNAVRASLVQFEAGDCVLVAISGGADSLALAYALSIEAPLAAIRVVGVTVDHQLQDASSKQASKVIEQLNGMGITENEIQKGINNSALVVGAYAENGRQIGFLRIVSDKIRFAYFTDVVVHPDFRRNGIGQQMVKFALSHPELKDVYQWLLATLDAHGVYAKCGFKPLQEPGKWMAEISGH